MLTSIPSAAVFAKSGAGHQARNGPIFGSGFGTMAMIVHSGVVMTGEGTGMASRTIPQAKWRAFFDGLADALVGKRVEVEAVSLDLGDQIVAEWVPLLGISYDSRDDLRDVALSGLNHLMVLAHIQTSLRKNSHPAWKSAAKADVHQPTV